LLQADSVSEVPKKTLRGFAQPRFKRALGSRAQIEDNGKIMLQLIQRPGLIAISVLACVACGGTTVDASDASAGASSVGGSTPMGGASSSCDVVSVTIANAQLCSPAIVCAKAQCDSALGQCLGADYKQGSYGTSDCAQYSACVSSCNCDSNCSSQCALSPACTQCLVSKIVPCAYTNCRDLVVACTTP
jgi:hypothetical protein